MKALGARVKEKFSSVCNFVGEKNKHQSISSFVVITFCMCGNFGNQKDELEQVYEHIPASGHHCISELERPVREQSWGDADYDTGLAKS